MNSVASSRANSRGRALWLAAAAAVAGLVVLSFLARSAAYFPLDVTLTEDFQRLHSTLLDDAALAVDWIGYLPQIVLVTLGLAAALYVAHRRWAGILTLGALCLEGALVGLIKVLVRRPRPEVPGIHVYQPLGDFTFPSGHVASYVMVFGFVAYVLYRQLRPDWLRRLLVALLVGLVVAVGPVRIYLGEHWPSDVVGGYLVGLPGLLAVIWAYEIGLRRAAQRSGKNPAGRT